MTDPLSSHSLSDPGRKRDNNEDSFLSDAELGLWAVADGMGGHDAGEVASAVAIQVLHEHCQRGKSLQDAIQAAHQSVISAVASGAGAEGMGSTIVALQDLGDRWEIAWVGDSRAYLWTADAEGGQLQQLSTDHSYVQMLFQSGAIEAEDLDLHPDKNVITQCLGWAKLKTVQVDSIEAKWQAGQSILLCSDGLSDELQDEKIGEILCNNPEPRQAADALMQAALEAGGSDNISVQIIQKTGEPSHIEHDTGEQEKPHSRLFPMAMLGLLALSLAALVWVAR